VNKSTEESWGIGCALFSFSSFFFELIHERKTCRVNFVNSLANQKTNSGFFEALCSHRDQEKAVRLF
jgi:hypothetical protein